MNVFDKKPVSGNPMRPTFGGVPADEAAAATMTQNRFNALMTAIEWAERDWEVEAERGSDGPFHSLLEDLRLARAVIEKRFPLQAKGFTEKSES